MAKKINLGTINETSLEKLSAFHVAIMELKSLRDVYKDDIEKLNAKKDALIQSRKDALASGMSVDEVAVKFDLLPIDNELRARTQKFEEDCKPHKASKKDALSLISENLYYAYVLSMKKGDLSARGTLTLKKGKKEEEYTVAKSFKDTIKDFLVEIGCDASNDTALNKFADCMKARTSGMRKCNRGEDYVTVKSLSQFNELFMLAFLQYTIIEKGVITVNDDATLSMTVYDEE